MYLILRKFFFLTDDRKKNQLCFESIFRAGEKKKLRKGNNNVNNVP